MMNSSRARPTPSAVGAVDQHDVGEAALGVEGEQNAGRPQVGANHLLHAHREGDGEVVEAAVHAVGDGPVGEQRRQALVVGAQHFLLAADVEEGLLLPGKAGRRQVLGRGAGAHGRVRLGSILAAQLRVGIDDLPGQVVRQRDGQEGLAEAPAALRQGGEVARVEALED